MDKEEVIQKTADYVKGLMSSEESSHDWWHVYRVWQIAKTIGKEENADLFVVQLAALLHDVDDPKVTGNTTSIRTQEWLSKVVDSETQEHTLNIIANMSFRKSLKGNVTLSLEGKVVQDADRLDAIGAIGIARAFGYGGHKGHELHNPDNKFIENITFDQYVSEGNTTVNHFYQKLLTLKDKMNTGTGKRLAEQRHKVMEDYLDRFYKEWDGQA